MQIFDVLFQNAATMHGFTTTAPTTSTLSSSPGFSTAVSSEPRAHAIVIGTGPSADQTAQLVTKLDCTASVCPSVRSALSSHSNGVDRLSAGTKITALVVLAGPLEDFMQAGVLEEVHRSFPAAKIVAVTPSTTVAEAVKAMRHGVADILLSSDVPDDLLDGLGRAFRSGVAVAAGAAQRRVLEDRLATLTAAEDKVLDEMLDGMANKQIAQKLEIGLRTVELRRSKIMRKMDAKSLSELVKFVCIARGIADLDVR